MTDSFTMNQYVGRSTNHTGVLPDGKDYVLCPIQNVHTIQSDTIQTHLVKCIKANNEKSHTMKPCPFDNTHMVSVSELIHHVSNCPKRALFDIYRFTMEGEEASANVPPPPVVLPPVEENWDDTSQPTYDREAELEDRPVIRRVNGLKPAERKKFRLNQRQRFGQR